MDDGPYVTQGSAHLDLNDQDGGAQYGAQSHRRRDSDARRHRRVPGYATGRDVVGQRTLRLADGPDAVHRMVVGRNEIKQYLAEAGEVAATFRDG